MEMNMEHNRIVLLEVGGMSCGGCAANVKRILDSRPGVEYSSVDLSAGRAEVCYRPAETGPEALAAALSRAGYAASLPSGAGSV